MTTHDSTDFSPEQLADELSWLRGLASRLVREADVAEDLVQDTLVVALERRGGGRPFLAGVLRNLSLRRSRGEGRRKVRERRGARPEAVDSAAELVKEIATQRELVSAVLRLDEPYRETLLLRFYRELKPKAIAERTGVSVNTVNSRLQRGLSQLRTQLDAEYGDRRTWCLALLPLVEPPPPAPWPLVGAATVKTTLAAAAALVAVSAGVLIPKLIAPEDAAVAADQELAATAAAPLGRPAVAEPASNLGSQPPRGPDGRTAVAASSPAVLEPVADLPAEPAATVAVRGRVVDVDGYPVSGVPLSARANGEEQDLVSADSGLFELTALPDDQVRIEVAGGDWVALREGFWDRSRQFEPLVVVAPPSTVAGRVVDVYGAPVSGARVEFQPPSDVNTRVGLELDATMELVWQTRSGADGSFRLVDVPTIHGSLVGAVHESFAAKFVDAPGESRDGFDIVLEPNAMLGALAVRGRVVDGNGLPLSDALVALGAAVVTTDEVGVFQLDPIRAVETETLTAVRAGYMPAVLERPGQPADDDTGWPAFVTVTLSVESLSIAGRLVDQRGEPVAGARVWADDTTALGAVGAYPLQLESVMAGGAPPADGFGMQAEMPTADGDARFGWYSVRDEPDAMWFFATTDLDGRFELGGLTDREYTLGVLLDDPLVRVTTAAVAAGSEGVDLTVELPDVHEVVRGRVVDERGEPVPGIRLQFYEVAETLRQRVLGGSTEMNLITSMAPQGTDEDGRFELRNVPVSGALLWATGDGILPTPRALPSDLDPADYQLELPCRRRVQIELADRSRADAFEILDAAGQVLPLYETSASVVRSTARAPLVDGRSSVQSVGLAASAVRLFKGGTALEELPISLSADGVNALVF